jgi:hypothetical protein
MQGFKKEKTAENQLFDVFFNAVFCDLESEQKSCLFEQNLDKELFFCQSVSLACNHLRNDHRHTPLFPRYKVTQILKINQMWPDVVFQLPATSI